MDQEEDHYDEKFDEKFEYRPGALGYNIEKAIKEDDEIEFVEQMKKLPLLLNRYWAIEVPVDPKFWPTKIMEWICRYFAVNCGTALLEGRTGVLAYLNSPVIYGLYPLHFVASCLSYGMVDLFLRHGAWTDVRGERTLSGAELLPLDASLEKLSYCHPYLVDWTPDQSIFKLIIALCLPHMKEPLEVNRLLAWNTKGVDEVFNHCVMNGKLAAMAALLMVAREKVMAPSMSCSKVSSGLGGSMTIRQCLTENISLIDEQMKSMGDGQSSEFETMCVEKATMGAALGLLDVFERVGDAIGTYVQLLCNQTSKDQVMIDVKTILEEAGFVLEDRDIDLGEDVGDGNEGLDFHSQMYCIQQQIISSSSIRHKGKSSFYRGSLASNRNAPFFRPPVRPYHTLPFVEEEFAFKVPRTLHLQEKRTRGVKQIFPQLLSGKKFLSFALAIKRGMTRI